MLIHKSFRLKKTKYFRRVSKSSQSIYLLWLQIFQLYLAELCAWGELNIICISPPGWGSSMYHLWVVSLFFDIYSCCCRFLPSNVARQWVFQEGLSCLRLRFAPLLWEAVLQFRIPQLFIKRQYDFASPEECICLADSPQRCWKQIYLPVLIVVLGWLAVSCNRKDKSKSSQEGLWAETPSQDSRSTRARAGLLLHLVHQRRKVLTVMGGVRPNL